MLLYEYRVRDEFDKARRFADNLRAEFAAGTSAIGSAR
jgi:hypothetical protein